MRERAVSVLLAALLTACASSGSSTGLSTVSVAPPGSSTGSSSVAPPGSSSGSAQAPAEGTRILASLGDSIASGMGAQGMTMPCARSDQGWTGVLAERTGMSFVNVACAGATIEDAFGQVDALPEDVSVVAVSVGGNTLGFGPALFLCAAGRCEESQAVADGNLPKIRPQMLELLRRVHARRPGAEAILVLLYPPITRPGLVCDGVDEIVSDLFARGPEMLNAELAAAVGDARSEGVPVVAFEVPEFSGHVLCTDDSWYHGFDRGVLALHPTTDGFAAAARAAESVLAAGVPSSR